ncbi:MAG TPA: NAD(P)/FAD-dependent oxidoreductase [Clostridia bacterium]|nr:NAD(P)/FAD-dependent oxidoreductase [Clostridia bacterium]
MKIAVAGAGIGGLVAAKILADNGHEVHVFEKSAREKISYDWHDDVTRFVFSNLGLPIPEGHVSEKKNWTFITPDRQTALTLDVPDDARDYSIDRRALAELYISRADKVNFRFGAKADGLIIENDIVKGITVGGEKVYADLVIDNSGVNSVLRKSLPASYEAENPSDSEVFHAYRAFHKRTGAPDPEFSNKVYLKHMGEMGISWCVVDSEDTVDILIGRIGKLTKENLKSALEALKADNPILADETVLGGGIYEIPVRRPALRFGGENYALIGDAAFMTIPVLGSGLENSMYAASILAQTIMREGNAGKETIWKYQAEYYKKVGHKHYETDIIKRWLLGTAPESLNYMFGRGVISAEDLQNGSSGGEVALTFGTIIDKVKKAFPRIDLLLDLKGCLDRSKKAGNAARAIPAEYDETAISKWEKSIKKFFN